MFSSAPRRSHLVVLRNHKYLMQHMQITGIIAANGLTLTAALWESMTNAFGEKRETERKRGEEKESTNVWISEMENVLLNQRLYTYRCIEHNSMNCL